MSIEIPVPDIGDFESVEIIEVLVKVGSNIKKDDTIVTLESDKSSVEVPSPFSGKISELKVKIGDKVSKGSVLALIEKNETPKETTQTVKKVELEEKSLEKKEDNILPITEKIIKQAETAAVGKTVEQKSEKIYVKANGADIDPTETQEWLDSIDAVLKKDGTDRAQYILKQLINEGNKRGSAQSLTRITTYINTIH